MLVLLALLPMMTLTLSISRTYHSKLVMPVCSSCSFAMSVCEYLLFCLDSRVCTELIVVRRCVGFLIRRKHIFLTVIGASTFSVPVDATPVCGLIFIFDIFGRPVSALCHSNNEECLGHCKIYSTLFLSM